MNKLIKVLLLLSIMLSSNACQTRTFFEEVQKDKFKSFDRNIIIFYSEHPSKLNISYSKKKDEKNNIVVEEEVITPCVWDMTEVIVRYDSLNFVQSSRHKVLGGGRRIKHNFELLGAEYLHIKNYSDQDVEFAIIGRQKLVLENVNMIKSHPTPIYRGVPLLYLLKPNLSPNRDLFFEAAKSYKQKGGLVSSESYLRKISLKPNLLGEFNSKDLPFSIKKILGIYKNQSSNLYLDYFRCSLESLGMANENIYYQELWGTYKKKLYGKIKANETLINKGELPILALEFTPSSRITDF